jgi:hypothetical protein
MRIEQYMRKPTEQTFITEEYVSSPPAAWIHNEWGDVFSLSTELGRQDEWPGGHFGWMVLVDQGQGPRRTGTVASQIERRNGNVRAFTRQGWRTWNAHVAQFL